MKLNTRYLFILLVPVLFVFCSEQEDEFGKHGEVVIEFGTGCGWCAGEERITVSSAKAEYYRNIPCGEEEGTTRKTQAMTSEEWEEIISSFDHDQFLTLDYNECNVCVDGCDEFIIITQNGSSHEIRYSPSEEIDGMDELRQLLAHTMEKVKASR